MVAKRKESAVVSVQVSTWKWVAFDEEAILKYSAGCNIGLHLIYKMGCDSETSSNPERIKPLA